MDSLAGALMEPADESSASVGIDSCVAEMLSVKLRSDAALDETACSAIFSSLLDVFLSASKSMLTPNEAAEGTA